MRAVLILAVCAASTAARAAPQPPFSIYPRVERRDGVPTIVLNVVNHTKRPLAICTSEHQCLSVEFSDGHGGWMPWELLPLPATPPIITLQDIAEILPEQSRDVFALPVRQFGGVARDFAIGAAHHVKRLPSHAQYRFTYLVDATGHAAFDKLHRADVAPGPEGSSASPMELLTLEDAEIVAAVKKGDVGVSAWVRAGDVALLPLLDPLLDHKDFTIAETAVYCVIATEAPEAVDRLLHVLATSTNGQLRSYATNGFRTIHPRAAAPRLVKALDHETDEHVIGGIVLALGEMDDPALLPELQRMHAAHPGKALDPEHPDWGSELAFELAGARLGDPASVEALSYRAGVVTKRMRGHEGVLGSLFHAMAYTHSPAVAHLLTEFFPDNHEGSRAAPYRDGPAPRNAKDAQAMADREKRAYVRVADDALFAVLEMFPDEPWHMDFSLHLFTAEDQRDVRAVVERRLAAARRP